IPDVAPVTRAVRISDMIALLTHWLDWSVYLTIELSRPIQSRQTRAEIPGKLLWLTGQIRSIYCRMTR
ncbi:MAG: hypothetical protein QOK11_3304, partial [Pseudonocardiales bacterium]|nr:hypothetical protein [Pseudonocardiales bacterium]